MRLSRSDGNPNRASPSPPCVRRFFRPASSVPDYSITFAKSARRELQKLSPQLVGRIFPKIEALAAAPRPPGCQKLKGNNPLWRIRIGSHRVLYSIDDAHRVVDVVAIGDRKEIYRD